MRTCSHACAGARLLITAQTTTRKCAGALLRLHEQLRLLCQLRARILQHSGYGTQLQQHTQEDQPHTKHPCLHQISSLLRARLSDRTSNKVGHDSTR